MLRLILLAVALALVLAAPSDAAGKVSQSDRFKLWNACRPMTLVVETLNDQAKKIGLSMTQVETAARSRLRAARMYSEERGVGWFYVQILVVKWAFAINIKYFKLLKDQASGHLNFAPTWSSGSAGMHGNDGTYIFSSLGRHIDKFIDEYLRVNESACQTSWKGSSANDKERR